MKDSAKLVHEDVGAAVFAAIPPRRVPLAKRLLWWLVLRLLASRTGRAIIAARQRPRTGE
ncbi:MAG: hypothetical protein KJS95_07475 [Gammaproteobacteria bacterium]|nr:hypothetical protein [Gammaproteobacteria bacterium]